MTDEPLRATALQLASDRQLIDELTARTANDPQRVFISMFVKPSETAPGGIDGWTTTKASDPKHLRVALIRLLASVGVHEAVADAVLPVYELKSDEVRVTHQRMPSLLGQLGQVQLQGMHALMPQSKASEDIINHFTNLAQLKALPASNLSVYVDKEGRIRLTVQQSVAWLVTETVVPQT